MISLRSCGPVTRRCSAAERTRERLWRRAPAVGAGPGRRSRPIFAASPYLAGLATRDRTPGWRGWSQGEPGTGSRADILARTAASGGAAHCLEAGAELRRLKAELHLLAALCDLGGRWNLEQVTGALSDFADAAVQTALAVAAADECGRGRLMEATDPAAGPLPGLFCLALGKHGAGELNYSSDIDICVFYAPDALPVAPGVDAQVLAVRVTRALSSLLQERTAEGYVFRVDLRLRPDPSATPVAMPVDAALDYYETSGQNWERAALIKARPCAGDLARGEAFLAALRPFVWRRNLDYAAIADIAAIKRQIHVHKVDERLSAPGHNLKLGAGGIREIEFFVQTQQLILGGRRPGLRCRRTLEALAALEAAGQVTCAAAGDLASAYGRLRGWEHRVQMISDEQTHVLPEDAGARDRRRRAGGLRRSWPGFDAAVSGDAGDGERPLRRPVRRGRGPVQPVRQPGLHRRGGRSGDAGDPGADGLLPARPGVGPDPRLGTPAGRPRPAAPAGASCSPAWPRACWRRPRLPAPPTPPSIASPTSSQGLRPACRSCRCSWPSRSCCSSWCG